MKKRKTDEIRRAKAGVRERFHEFGWKRLEGNHIIQTIKNLHRNEGKEGMRKWKRKRKL